MASNRVTRLSDKGRLFVGFVVAIVAFTLLALLVLVPNPYGF